MNDAKETIIEARAVGKVYWDGNRRLQVLKNITLNVREGEGVAVLGPSGSGKTTLLNILSGLDKPSEGEVDLAGVSIHALNDRERAFFTNRTLGFVFQFYHLLPEFTAIENVMLPSLIGLRGEGWGLRKKAHSLLEQVGLKDRAAHYPSELSGGEQQRVAIARALVNDPKILFCDEPTGNLDHRTGLEVIKLLREFGRKKNKAMLLVTHDEKVAAIADRVLDIGEMN